MSFFCFSCLLILTLVMLFGLRRSPGCQLTLFRDAAAARITLRMQPKHSPIQPQDHNTSERPLLRYSKESNNNRTSIIMRVRAVTTASKNTWAEMPWAKMTMVWLVGLWYYYVLWTHASTYSCIKAWCVHAWTDILVHALNGCTNTCIRGCIDQLMHWCIAVLI